MLFGKEFQTATVMFILKESVCGLLTSAHRSEIHQIDQTKMESWSFISQCPKGN
jgi:hypothetical protein